MSNAARLSAVDVCCLLAAMAPFLAGARTAALAVVPLGVAIWLLGTSPWRTRTRLGVFLGALLAGVIVFIVFLALVLRYANN
jgi:hypothetical protein